MKVENIKKTIKIISDVCLEKQDDPMLVIKTDNGWTPVTKIKYDHINGINLYTETGDEYVCLSQFVDTVKDCCSDYEAVRIDSKEYSCDIKIDMIDDRKVIAVEV